MKGFPIQVKNDLLEPKHVKNMGKSVWLYLWFIDKMTSIDENRIGLVLGGRPIKFYEVEEDLGITKNIYTEWIQKLEAHKYISTKRTPQGIVFKVTKAKKKFRENQKKRFPENLVVIPGKSGSDSRKTRNALYTYTNNTNREASKEAKNIGEILKKTKEKLGFLKTKKKQHERN